MQIVIVGSGYVGLTTAFTSAFLGHEVCAVDVDEHRVRGLCAGRLPFHEPHLAEMFDLVRANLSFTTDYSRAIPGADVVFITVGTPSQGDGQPDLTALNAAAHDIGCHLGSGHTVVVNKSTVPIGCGNWVESLLHEACGEAKADAHFSVASNPEFLREGSALHDSLYPDRIVLGSDAATAIDVMQALYRPLVEQRFAAPAFLPRPENLGAVPLITTDLASAELVKYAANAFLSLKISFINDIAELSERVGGDISQVARAIGLDSRIGPRFLHAGIGWGGSCFGKDTSALLAMGAEYGVRLPTVAASREVNFRQRDRAVEKLQRILKILKGRTIGLLGLTFKPHTDDLRDSPALDIARRLLARGARVRAHDPIAIDKARRDVVGTGIVCCESAAATAVGADALVVATEWPEYQDLPWSEIASSMRTPVLLDGRNFLDEHRLRESGLAYYAIGK